MTRISIAALASLVAGLAILVELAGATPSSNVSLELLRNGPPDRATTTWSSSGAVSASGTWVIDRFVCGACPAPTTGAFQFDATLSASDGSIEMRLRNVFNQSVDDTYWEIVGGSGAYKDLRGHGSYEVWLDSNDIRHIVCDGEVHVA